MDAEECKEEQEMELEALESMYCDDFERLDDPEDEATLGKFTLKLAPGDTVDGEIHVRCLATFTYTPTYPETSALMELTSEVGLSDELLDELRGALEAAAEENLGMAHVFTLGETTKEWLEDHNVKQDDGAAHSRMMARKLGVARQLQKDKDESHAEEVMRKERVEAERERVILEGGGTGADIDGTQTTLSTFLDWRRDFDMEMTAVAKLRLAAAAVVVGRGGKSKSKSRGGGGAAGGAASGEYDDEEEGAEDGTLHVSVLALYMQHQIEQSNETGRIWYLEHSRGVSTGGAGDIRADSYSVGGDAAGGAVEYDEEEEEDDAFNELLDASHAAREAGEDAGAVVLDAVEDASIFMGGAADALDDLELSESGEDSS